MIQAEVEKNNIVLRGGKVESIQHWVVRDSDGDAFPVLSIKRILGDRFAIEIGDPECRVPVYREGSLDEIMAGPILPRDQCYYRALFILSHQTPDLIRQAGYRDYLIVEK